MNKIRTLLFVLMVLAQLAVPLYVISTQERTLEAGVTYKFRCGPVDPYDIFRGRYVTLSFPDMRIEDWGGNHFSSNDTAYAVLGVGEDGYVAIEDVRPMPPTTDNYVEVDARTFDFENRVLQISLPFNRYYMNEFDAPEAERLYRGTFGSEAEAHVLVRVFRGRGVIEGLYIDDVPVERVIAEAGKTPADNAVAP